MKTYIRPLGILGLDFNDRLRSVLPEVRVGTGCIVLGHAPGVDSIDVGLRVGDVIHSLNRTEIESVEQLRSAVAHLQRGDSVVLRIERMGQFQFLAFEMD
jgi:S1-C subfamily serine protease